MAIVPGASATGDQGWGTTLTINKPASVADGDVMVAFLQVANSDATITAPAGWTLEATANGAYVYQRLYWKVAATEGASYQWSWATAAAGTGGITRYSGVDTTTVEDVTSRTNTGTSTAPRGLTITTVTDGACVVMGVGHGVGSVTQTAPTGMTEQYESNRVAYDDVIQVTAGASGNKDATLSSSDDWGTIIWALRPAGGGGETPTLVVANLVNATRTTAIIPQQQYNLKPVNLVNAVRTTSIIPQQQYIFSSVKSLANAMSLTGVIPQQQYILAGANLVNATRTTSVTPQQQYILPTYSAVNSHTVTNVTPQQQYNLNPANLVNQQTLTNTILTYTEAAAGVIVLVVASLLTGHSLTRPDLAQSYNLVVQNLRNGMTLSSLILAVWSETVAVITHKPGHAKEEDVFDKIRRRWSDYDDRRQRGRTSYDKLRGSRK
jgi:hypothetical protein